jgi:DNA-binding CsgD family transcriptional regulator/GAF domain-containing protein
MAKPGSQADDFADWVGAGPTLAPDLVGEVSEVLGKVREWLPDFDHPPVRDHGSAVAAVTAALAAFAAESAAPMAPTRLLLALHDLDRRLLELQLERATASRATIIRALPRLEAAAWSVPELISVAPEMVCELGFDRGMISRVENNIWYPELMFAIGDPETAAETIEAGKAVPQPIAPGLYEAELIRDQKPILVRRVQEPGERDWTNQEMVVASRTRSYVAAPIVVDGRVVGMLHADCYRQRRDLDELDREILWAFAQAFRIVLSRAALNERLAATQVKLRHLSTALDGTSKVVGELPLVRLDRPSGDGLVIRFGTRRPEFEDLPDTLTRREHEVLALLAGGRTNLAIAQQLSIAEETAKQHVKHILRKLGVANRAEAVARWFQAGGGAE